MSAKRDRGWRSGKREGRARKVQMTRHLIVTEGRQTEPRYFEGMKAALGAESGRKLSVVVKGSGKHTIDLLEYAVELCRYAPETFDHVWLVFDKDDFPADDFDAMERACSERSDESRKFHALWSNPCFELWPLLHLRYTTAQMSSDGCQRMLVQILDKECGVEYRKNLGGLFELVDKGRGEAIERARQLEEHHAALGNVRPSEKCPATRVGDVFAEIGPYLGC